MQIITPNDAHIIRVGAEHMEDIAEDQRDQYDREDRESVQHMKNVRRGFLVTGDEVTAEQAEALLKAVVQAELDSWIPDASQRLIGRAASALGFSESLLDPIIQNDHGMDPAAHALCQDWICGIFVLRCVTCAHLFKI